jgi:hypothetical protein
MGFFFLSCVGIEVAHDEVVVFRMGVCRCWGGGGFEIVVDGFKELVKRSRPC